MTTRPMPVLPALSALLGLLLLALPARAEETRWALLVGIDDYIDPAISDLTGSVNDVVAIREALVTAAHFPSGQVFLLTSDYPGNEPTKGNIRARLAYIADHVDSDDLVYLHFSLHAVVDEQTGDGYLLTHRTDPREYRSDAFPVSELKALVEEMSAPKRVLVIDGCRNDPERGRGDAPNRLDARFSRGLTIVPRAAPSANAFTQVLYACSVGQRAYEWPGRDRGLFSVALEEALLGEADAAGGDGDGHVALSELAVYVRRRVPDLVQLYLPSAQQMPDVADLPKAVAGYRLADVQTGVRKLTIGDLPATKARPAEVEQLEEFVARQGDKAPTVKLTAQPSEPLTRVDARRITLRWAAEVDRGVKGYRWRLDDRPVTETARAYADVSAAEPGTHTFQVQVQDTWGNWSAPASCEFTVLPNRRPTVTFATPSAAGNVRGETLDVRLSGGDEDGSVVRYRLALDEPDDFVERADGRFALQDVVDGPHTLFAQALDDEGAASLWESLTVEFAYVDPAKDLEHRRLDEVATRRGVATVTTPGAERWTRGRPAPEVAGFAYVGENAQGHPEYDKPLGNGVSMRFVLVPAGSFSIGSPVGEPGRTEAEGPQHRVTLDAFLLAKTECTQRQWQAVMGDNPSYFRAAGPDAPVENISWDDVQAFERKTGLVLPSESQWEYGCRAGSTTALSTGALTIRGLNNGPELDPIAWYGGNSGVDYEGGLDSSAWVDKQHPHTRAGTHPVGQKQPNAFGLHDMLGNVVEWCEDDWLVLAGIPADGRPGINTPRTTDRAARGGSISGGCARCRSAMRNGFATSARYCDLGFRAASSVATEIAPIEDSSRDGVATLGPRAPRTAEDDASILAFTPPEAELVVMLDAADLRESALWPVWLRHTAGWTEYEDAKAKMGFDPAEAIESIVVWGWGLDGSDPAGALGVRFDPSHLAKVESFLAGLLGPATQARDFRSFVQGPNRVDLFDEGLCFVCEPSYVPSERVERSSVESMARRLEHTSTVAAAYRTETESSGEFADGLSPPRSGTAWIDVSRTADLDVALTFADDESARAVQAVLADGLPELQANAESVGLANLVKKISISVEGGGVLRASLHVSEPEFIGLISMLDVFIAAARSAPEGR